ncbi:unnamed protein product, partial [Trichobilharzia szidati]
MCLHDSTQMMISTSMTTNTTGASCSSTTTTTLTTTPMPIPTSNTSTDMLPPKTPQSATNSSHQTNLYHQHHHQHQHQHHHQTENSLPGDDDDDTAISLDGTCYGANLNEDSMMILSQSIDSIHTVGTNNGEGNE